MRIAGLILRSLVHFRWQHVTTVLAVGAASTVLAGALVIGDSMRDGLRSLAMDRIAEVNFSLTRELRFRADWVADIFQSEPIRSTRRRGCAVLRVRGAAEHPESHARANGVSIWGVDEQFWQTIGRDGPSLRETGDASSGPLVALGEALSEAIQARVGDDVLFRIEQRNSIPEQTLLGRGGQSIVSLRARVKAVLPMNGAGGFALRPAIRPAMNAFLLREELERLLNAPGRADTMLISIDRSTDNPAFAQDLHNALDETFRWEDLGIRLDTEPDLDCIVISSDHILIDPEVERAVNAAAANTGAVVAPVLTYLANNISFASTRDTESTVEFREGSTDRAIPYSTVCGISLSSTGKDAVSAMTGASIASPGPNEIVLNDWAAQDLHVQPGDRIRLQYYSTGPMEHLEERDAWFILKDVIRIQGIAADRALTPEYHGVTDVRNIADWDPPFPMDMKRIRDKDETYWDEYGSTPKAFVDQDVAAELWGATNGPNGRWTSLRVMIPKGADPTTFAEQFSASLRSNLELDNLGLIFTNVLTEAKSASHGSTDFASLFLGLSAFLVAACGLITMLFMRFGIEQRAKQVGILQALGIPRAQIQWAYLAEGAIPVILGAALGLFGAKYFASSALEWVTGTWHPHKGLSPFPVHVRPASLLIGGTAAAFVGIGAMVWALRGLGKQRAAVLISGAFQTPLPKPTTQSRQSAWIFAVIVFIVGLIAFVTWAAATDRTSPTIAFFLIGTALLSIWLVVSRSLLKRPYRSPRATADQAMPANAESIGHSSAGPSKAPRPLQGLGADRDPPVISTAPSSSAVRTIRGLAFRNLSRNAGRSLLVIGTIAVASYLLGSVSGFGGRSEVDPLDRQSGTGGYVLLGEASVPLRNNMNNKEGQEALSLSAKSRSALSAVHVVGLRTVPGDEAGCLNPFRAVRPTLIGVPDEWIDRGGFHFSHSEAESAEERQNPWLLLRGNRDAGVIPAIGDTNVVTWQLGSGVGRELMINDAFGRPIRLRFVALLSESALQSEIFLSESSLLSIFPETSGYGAFALELKNTAAPTEQQDRSAARSLVVNLESALETDLSSFGVDIVPMADRLRQYQRVEQGYLQAFQFLGILAVLLGTLGLAAVIARQIVERRNEFALLQAVGFSRGSLVQLVTFEALILMAIGLFAGITSAATAVAPYLWQQQNGRFISGAALALIAVTLTGVGSTALVAICMLRGNLIADLRRQ